MSKPALTEAIATAIVGHLEGFVSLETACALEGQRVETVRGWLKRGADARRRLDLVTDESRAYAEFHKRADAAIAKRKAMFAKLCIERAQDIPTANGLSRGDPKWAAHLMAILHPREFNRTVRVEVESELSAAVERLYRRLPPEQAAAAVAALAHDDDFEGGTDIADGDSGEEGASEEGE